MLRLTALQCRILGVMLEKESTTPEQYPLSLNALTNGCNQKSNREPVMSLSETQVQGVLDELIESKQVMIDTGASGRVNKYKHRFCNTSFGDLQLTEQQKAIICVLFLRGPQTPGELRTRTHRLADFTNVHDVEVALAQLDHLNNQSLVKKLTREAGKRESRYIHLFSDIAEIESALPAAEPTDEHGGADRQEKLVLRIESLEHEIVQLKAQLADLTALIKGN